MPLSVYVMATKKRAGCPGAHQTPNSDAAASATRPPAITRSLWTRDASGGGRFIRCDYKRSDRDGLRLLRRSRRVEMTQCVNQRQRAAAREQHREDGNPVR